MDLPQLSSIIMNLPTLVFVVTSMLAMGLSLTVAQIPAPLRNARLVILALAVNFILVPSCGLSEYRPTQPVGCTGNRYC